MRARTATAAPGSRRAPAATEWQYGLAGLYTRDDGWRIDSGFDEAKFSGVASGRWGDTATRLDLAATWLDQDTAGFITGQGAYRSEQASRQNDNPEAYRQAHAVRLTGLLQPVTTGDARLELRPYLRTSRMEFLQHFLLGKPLEENGQESAGLMTSLTWDANPARTLVAGLDLEAADSFLRQNQDGPTTDAPPAAIAIRPPGLHYDYTVRSYVAALYAHGEWRLGDRWRATAGLRGEAVNYDYDNLMLAGNTDQDGVPCGATGCLYSRPADRTDAFLNLAPKLGLSFDLRDGMMAYLNASVGFRPPEMTELYRLQRTQRVADLDAERLEALELGLKGAWPSFGFAVAAFDMRKKNVILRDSNGFNVDDGRTSHRGFEYDLRWSALDDALTGAGRHLRAYIATNSRSASRAASRSPTATTSTRHRARSGGRPSTGNRRPTGRSRASGWSSASTGSTRPTRIATRVMASSTCVAAGRCRRPGPRRCGSTTRSTAATPIAPTYAFGTYRYFPGRGRALFAEIAWQVD